MSTRLSPPQVEQLKRRAKELRRTDASLSQSDALNQVARENGWTNWALLARNSLPSADNLISLAMRRIPDGMEGVFLVDIDLVDAEVRQAIGGDSPSFDLPELNGWVFRGAGHRQFEHLPYITLRFGPPRGVLVDGKWRAILSINGVQPAEIRSHIASTLPRVLHGLKVKAFTCLLPYIARSAPTSGGRVRLFFSRPGENDVPEIAERSYTSIDEAKTAQLPEGWTKIGIPLSDGNWVTYQLPFGWSA